jgi:hypothetical protein
MDQIEFADGFDTPDTLAFGLGAGQLAVVMAGALAAYSLVRSTLPPVVVDPLAIVLAGAAAVLGWLKVSGRPALDWAVFASRFWMRPRRGIARWELAIEVPTLAKATTTEDRQSDPTGAETSPIGEQSGATPSPPLSVGIPPLRVPPPARAHGARRVTFFSLRGGTGRSTLARSSHVCSQRASTTSTPHRKSRSSTSTCAARASPSVSVLPIRRCSTSRWHRPTNVASSTSWSRTLPERASCSAHSEP